MAKAKALEGKKLEIDIDGFIMKSDLPKSMGGTDEHPNPMQFLQSALLACATAHVFAYLDKTGQDRRQYKTELAPVFAENGDIEKATILIYAPVSFPAEKEAALIAAAQNCIVGRHFVFPRNAVVIKQ
jgi:uncharacterized OsmC-like protein